MEESQEARERSKRGNRPSRFSDSSLERDRSPATKKSSNNRVYVSNINYEVSWQDLKDMFRKEIGEVAFVKMFVDENDKPKGCAIVEFSDPESVQKCLNEMHSIELKGRKLIVKEDFGPERDKHGIIFGTGRGNRHEDVRDRRDFRRDNMVNNCSMGPTWGLSPNFLQSLGINKPLISKIFIANLDYAVDEKKLREVFKLAGRIVDLEICRDKENKSRGFALIEYDHPVEAVQAISMFHNRSLLNRMMAVRMDDHFDNKLPAGLDSIGMGLGIHGEPLRDVRRYLPSANCSLSELGGIVNSGPGIFGNISNPGLQNLSTAFTNVVNTPTLAGLASASAALQSLSAVPNQLLANELGFANLKNSLVGSSLGPNAALSVLANQMGNIGAQPVSYNHLSNNNSVNQLSNSNQGGNMNRTSSMLNTYDVKIDNNYRDGSNERQQNNSLYSANNVAPTVGVRRDNTRKSDTILVSNLPPTITWQKLQEKFSHCGDVHYAIMKTEDSALVRYAHDYEAAKAIQLMDRARIDGRTIDVRLFF